MALYQIALQNETFSLMVNDESRRVVQAPPVARWAGNKEIDRVLAFYRKKGAKIELINTKEK
jgi:hypothetical protein